MKKLIVFCLLLACTTEERKCGVALKPATEQSESSGKSPRYWKDYRTGLCFAEFQTAYAHYVSTNVPCSAAEGAIVQDLEKSR